MNRWLIAEAILLTPRRKKIADAAVAIVFACLPALLRLSVPREYCHDAVHKQT